MIIQPDFLRHWKTQKLVAMTGNVGSPLALVRLWSHCQTSRKWEFPGLTREDLAIICEWDSLKISEISCEKALIACKWIEKMQGRGYRVRNWAEHNKNLITNWNRNPSGKPRDDLDSNPTGTPRAPHGHPTTYPTKPNQTKSDEPNPTRRDPSAGAQVSQPTPGQPPGMDRKEIAVGNGVEGGVGGLVKDLARNMKPRAVNIPILADVRHYLSLQFAGAVDYAEAFYRAMEKQRWHDQQGKPITNWQAMAKAYASKAHLAR